MSKQFWFIVRDPDGYLDLIDHPPRGDDEHVDSLYGTLVEGMEVLHRYRDEEREARRDRHRMLGLAFGAIAAMTIILTVMKSVAE